jgi:hypothetical protein
MIHLADAVTGTGGTIVLPVLRVGAGCDVLIEHHISGGSVGGYVKVLHALDTAGATTTPHHGAGNNLPSANTLTSYSCAAYDVSDYVVLELITGDTTAVHDVWAQVLS